MKLKSNITIILLQGVKFIGISGIGWILDFLVFSLLRLVSDNVVLNNIIGSWVGITFVFIFSTRKLFSNTGRISLWIKYLIYIFYQCLLIFLISLLVGEINAWITNNVSIEIINKFSFAVSKVLVTPITMILNFIVMKTIIERIK